MSSFDNILKRSAARHGGRPAIVWQERSISYAELDRRVDHLASQLSSEVSPGQRVGVLAPNAPSLVVSLLAACRRGAVPVLLNVRWREYELRRILEDAELVEMLCVPSHGRFSFASLLAQLQSHLPTLQHCRFVDPLGELCGESPGSASRVPDPLNEQIGVLHYTSGTTGQPKGVPVRRITGHDGAAALNDVLLARPEDVVLLVIPISHAFGLYALLAALAAGSLVVLVDSTFSLAPVLEAMRRHRANLLHGPPSLFASLYRSGLQELSGLRTGLVGGAVCPPDLLENLDRAGVRILNSYGMTELGPATSCRLDDPPAVRYQSVGQPLPRFEFRVVGGREGEIQVRSPYVTPGYYRRAEETAAVFSDGWFRTGDVGSLDAQGNLSILGRRTDMIHVAGSNVFPAEVEGCLLTHPDVIDAVVMGVPHETMGQVPAAFVVPRPKSELTKPQLLQFARSRIAGYKVPYVVRFVSQLPRLATGKPDRAALARQLKEERHVRENACAEPSV